MKVTHTNYKNLGDFIQRMAYLNSDSKIGYRVGFGKTKAIIPTVANIN